MIITQAMFLDEFKKAVDTWAEAYKQDPDAEDPLRIWWSRNFDEERMKEMPEEFHAMAEQVKRHNGSYHDLEQLCHEYSYHLLSHELREWFQVNGYDYENIPKAPDIDHATKVKLKGDDLTKFKLENDADAKTVVKFGQIAYTGSSNQHHGWGKLYYADKLMLRFYPSTSGLNWSKETTEAIWRLGSKLSALTDWSVIDDQPKKVQRAIYEKVKELVEQEGLRSVVRYG